MALKGRERGSEGEKGRGLRGDRVCKREEEKVGCEGGVSEEGIEKGWEEK
jgi:hypothetical protein